jgi:hypothetical protein
LGTESSKMTSATFGNIVPLAVVTDDNPISVRPPCPSCGRPDSSSDLRVIDATRSEAATILTNNIMISAYATVLVVLSIGVVVLTVVLMVLCFFYPEKANALLLLIASPMALMVLEHAMKLFRLIKENDQHLIEIRKR